MCGSVQVRFFQTVDQRRYRRCERCLATFLDPVQRLNPGAEKAHYDLHQNTLDDHGYRAFLNRLAEPLIDRLEGRKKGLDYGCGPGPLLARIFEQAGHPMSIWDPVYWPDESVLKQQYDFVTCTEVAEHLFDPAESFARIFSLIKPGGWLGLMTVLQTDDARFARWYYRRDPTHVVFYREHTLRWLASRYGCSLIFPENNVALFQTVEARQSSDNR